MAIVTEERARQIVAEATAAANAAGDEWLKNATPKYAVYDADLFGNQRGPVIDYMLDLCGNAHVQFRDRRSAWFKAFEKYGLVRKTGNAVVEIAHKFWSRQEYGLRKAVAKAALKSLADNGVPGLRIWDYID